MSQTSAASTPLQVLTPELHTILASQTEQRLLNIIKTNSRSQYASQTTSLDAFRNATSLRGIEDDTILLQHFRDHVPISDYEAYKPWVTRFNECPCLESRVENLLAPGLPFYIAMSSVTAGKEPKLFPAYQHPDHVNGTPPLRPYYDFSDARGPTAWLFYYGYKDLKEVEREPGQIVKSIPAMLGSGGGFRLRSGWNIESDHVRLPIILPGQVAPWAANLIKDSRAYLLVHALFCLACRDLDQIFVTFIPFFIDFVRHIGDEWELLVACINDGTIPALDGLAEFRVHLQPTFHPNPERAAELYKIGPPSPNPQNQQAWAARVWPRLQRLGAICSGPYEAYVSLARSILGPTIAIRNHGYVCSESRMAVCFDPADLNSFVLETNDVLEFLDENAEETSDKLLQAWEIEAGKRFQIVLTTCNGLWRYLLGDLIEIVGFAPQNGSPVLKYIGRKALTLWLPHAFITDVELVEAVRKVNSEELIQIQEFTTVHDERTSPSAVGFFIELAGPLGPNAHTAAQMLFDALGEGNPTYYLSLETRQTRLPTIRIVRPGTFMECRQWKCETMGVGLGRVKVPVVLLHREAHEWFLERVTQEL